MCLKCNVLLLITLTITLHARESTSSTTNDEKWNLGDRPTLSSDATPTFKPQSKQLRNQCLSLPSLGKPMFGMLIKEKCYVDKTEYLNKLIERAKDTYFFLSRPRRFGKTLLIDTMQQFFNGKRDLFKDTKIYERHPNPWTRYPTIRIDLSAGISSDSKSEFKSSLKEKLIIQANSINIHLISTTVEGVIDELIMSLCKKFNSKVVILVDEYDSPYTSAYQKIEVASDILQVLQSFFKTLKGQHANIHFCFVTGITRLALSDFFSGFNAAIDLTMDPEYAGIVGFNEIELRQYFGAQIKDVATARGKKEETILENMRVWHDGFQFTSKCETLYSPCSVIGYLRMKGGSTTSWSDTGEPSKFLIEKLKQFPKKALQFLLNHRTNYQADKMEERPPPLLASRKELTGKIDFGKSNVKALIALLFHNGYFSIRKYDTASDFFTLNFTNFELEEDYAMRLAHSLTETFPGRLINKIQLMAQDLDAYRWKSFCEKLDSYNAEIPYQITTNQQKGREAWFQFNLFLMLTHAETYQQQKPAIEDSTNMGWTDIVFTNGLAVYIFEPKMVQNPENPVYTCKEKYVKKYLFDSKKNVFCIGLKFLMQGSIHSWGVASFSYDGKLVGEDGPITLTNQLSSKERQDISDKMTNYTRENPQCTLKPERLFEFLEQVGPTTEGQLVFAEKFSENTETLCRVLKEIKLVVQPNLKGIIFSFLKAATPYINNLAVKTPVNSDSGTPVDTLSLPKILDLCKHFS